MLYRRKIQTEADIKQYLSPNLKSCVWFDCLGRRVYIRLNALEEVKELVEEHLNDPSFDLLTDHFPIHETILDMIRAYIADVATLSSADLD